MAKHYQRRLGVARIEEGVAWKVKEVCHYISDGDWEEFEMKAVSIIRLSLAHEVKYWVLSKTSPQELWKKLEKIYMSKLLLLS